MFRLKIDIVFEIGKKRNAAFGLTDTSWHRVRKIVKKRDNETCQYCGTHAPDGEVDHILPLSRGGTDHMDNLTWACTHCNSSKGNKTLAEWSQPLEQAEQLDTPVPDSEDTWILELYSLGKSRREISELVWGPGKYGSFYNQKLEHVINRWDGWETEI